MTREELMQLGLEEELAEQVAEAVQGEMDALRMDAAVERMLVKNGARCLPAAKAMLKLEGLALQEVETGVQAQIDALRTDAQTAFLFAPPWEKFRGIVPAEGMNRSVDEEPARMSDAELCAYLDAHPEARL